MDDGRMNVGIGFATGRKQFRRILRTYVRDWEDSGLVTDERVGLNVFVAYDLAYHDTKKTDYTCIDDDVVPRLDHVACMGQAEFRVLKDDLAARGVVSPREADDAFGRGYAAQRNVLLYEALRNGMDCLVFFDDDEYPLAVSSENGGMVWRGQHVLQSHIEHIQHADITCGQHCGCVSPIPRIEYGEAIDEDAFRLFIEAISNDIVTWPAVRHAMDQEGLTYADADVLEKGRAVEQQQIAHAKFISGSNLGISLVNPQRVFPFFNPPGARGEDTFLGTCLADRTVMNIPCYAFHDAFSAYSGILDGTLPTRPKPISADFDGNTWRFLRACLGWVRYKPLLMFITDRSSYRQRICKMTDALQRTLPAVCRYFGTDAFMRILDEAQKYDRLVERHYRSFVRAKQAWAKVMASFA